jgi:hypothetical protein
MFIVVAMFQIDQAKISLTTIGGQMPRPGENHRIVDST